MCKILAITSPLALLLVSGHGNQSSDFYVDDIGLSLIYKQGLNS